MDAYHKVLQKLYEVTDGRESKAIDFRELMKEAGFYANYHDVLERMCREGWIIETTTPDYVRITHWGVAEAKKPALTQTSDANKELRREVNRALAAAKELSELLEGFAQGELKDNFSSLGKKFDELQNSISQIKKNMS